MFLAFFSSMNWVAF
uniref:Uncharacterized protein n=1 Tax=Rhizophora mucronata TaxID=61149 RepID=A0A2P2NIX1_RHIMU